MHRHRNRLVGLAVAIAVPLLGAAPARALSLAFTATLSFSYRPTVAPAPILFPQVAGGGIATVNGVAPGGAVTALALPAAAISAAASEPFASTLAQGLSLAARNGAGSFAFAGGAGGGTMPLFGAAKICLLATCGSASVAQAIPLAGVVGVGGATPTVGALGSLTVIGAPWTIGTATLINGVFTAMGFGHGPLSNTGTTAQPGGEIQLVTPILIRASTFPPDPITSFATLKIHFVPEPVSLLLVGAGVALLGLWRKAG